MKNTRNKLISLFLILMTYSLSGGYFNTGNITFTQPNDVTFTGRYWGDEFADWMETDEGYRFEKNWNDGYYYYAILDVYGEFAPSNKKVGIDTQLASSYKLERSQSRKAEIEAEIDDFNQQCDLRYQEYLAKKAADPNGNTHYKLGVVLIDFTPSERHRENPQYPNGYEKMLYDSLIFSRHNWVGVPNPDEGELPTPHPEGHELFGSFSDYYWEQSLGTVTFEGKDGLRQIVNPINPDDPEGKLPLWVVLPRSKVYYAVSVGLATYFNAAEDSAGSQLGIDMSQFEKVAFISAGPLIGGNIQGVTNINGRRYNMYEVSLYSEPYFFSHIGSHAHEFGHILGLYHNQGVPSYWNLMGYSSMGPNYEGACPSSLSPYQRGVRLGLVPVDTISADTVLTIHYDYENPRFYLTSVPNTNNYYLLENRLREGFDLWTPHDPSYVSTDPVSIDPNGNLGGLLIWKTLGWLDVADNVWEPDPHHNFPDTPEEMLNLSRDPFPYDQQDGFGSGLNFNDYTNPGTKRQNSYSYFAINDITWNSNDSSTTVQILFDYDPAPAAPSVLTWTNSDENPLLSWNPVGDWDMSKYYVYRNLYGCGPNCGPYPLIAVVGKDTTSYLDTQVPVGNPKFSPNTAYYYVTAVDLQDNESSQSNTVSVPTTIAERTSSAVLKPDVPDIYSLYTNSPNPFNPTTTVRYDLPEQSHVSMVIYDILGREVRTLFDNREDAGFKSVFWDGKDNSGNIASAGVYIYALRARSQESEKMYHKTHKMVLLR